MTEEELISIAESAQFWVDSGLTEVAECSADKVLALVAEVRRLRGLLTLAVCQGFSAGAISQPAEAF